MAGWMIYWVSVEKKAHGASVWAMGIEILKGSIY